MTSISARLVLPLLRDLAPVNDVVRQIIEKHTRSIPFELSLTFNNMCTVAHDMKYLLLTRNPQKETNTHTHTAPSKFEYK